MSQENFRDPYSSQNRRAAEIAERYAATHTPDTLPEHLKGAMAAAEANFAKTIPGRMHTAEIEAPVQEDPAVPPETYFDPTTGIEHEIDQDRPVTDKDVAKLADDAKQIAQAKAEARKIAGVTSEPRGDTAARGHGKTVGHLIGRGFFS